MKNYEALHLDLLPQHAEKILKSSPIVLNKLDSYLEENVSNKSIKIKRYAENYYEDKFKKSSAKFSHLAVVVYRRTCLKFIGKPVKSVIASLKNHRHYSYNSSFKSTIDQLIKDELLHKITSDSRNYFYVDDNGLIQDASLLSDYNHHLYCQKYFKDFYPEYSDIANNLYQLTLLKDFDDAFKYYDTDFKVIVRHKGLHYYVTNPSFSLFDIKWVYLPRLRASHYAVREKAKSDLQLLKVPSSEIKLLEGLKDIHHNFLKGV